MENELNRVVRGGGWYGLPSVARVASRVRLAPGNRDDDLGVRLIRIINPLQQLGEVKNGQ